MIIACIAMEELALSHILNAGGEHLQFVLGALPGMSSQDVLAVHKSIAALVESVTHNQLLLKNKLDHILEFVPRPSEPSQPAFPVQPPDPSQPAFPSQPPSPPPPSQTPPYVPACPMQYPAPVPRPDPYRVLSCQKSSLRLTGQKILWNPDGRLPWRQRSRSGRDICWNGHAPEQIFLNPGKTYVVQYTLNVCAMSPAEGTGSILLRQSPCGAFADTQPLCLALGCLTHGPQTLHHVSVLHPCINSGCGVELSLVLNAKTPLCVERAEMDIVDL